MKRRPPTSTRTHTLCHYTTLSRALKGRDKGRLIGIVTDGDLSRHIEGDLLAQTVDTVMTRSPMTIAPDALAVEALREMNSRRITAFFAGAGKRKRGR